MTDCISYIWFAGAEVTWTHLTFLAIDQRDEETWYDQQEDKYKDRDKGLGVAL